MISVESSRSGSWANTVDSEKRRVQTELRGRLNLELVRELQAQIKQLPGFDPQMDHLVDCRELVSVDTPFWNFRSMHQTSPFHPSARQAVVIRSSLGYGTVRAYQNLNALEPSVFRIFDNISDAERWLDEPRSEKTGE